MQVGVNDKCNTTPPAWEGCLSMRWPSRDFLSVSFCDQTIMVNWFENHSKFRWHDIFQRETLKSHRKAFLPFKQLSTWVCFITEYTLMQVPKCERLTGLVHRTFGTPTHKTLAKPLYHWLIGKMVCMFAPQGWFLLPPPITTPNLSSLHDHCNLRK